MKRIVWPFTIVFVVIFCFFVYGCVPLRVSPPGTKPIITHAFIPKERGRYGDVLKIYIEAEDPNGYMFKIFTVVGQSGYGRYFPDTTFVKPQDQHRLTGYLQWNTFSSRASWLQEWTQIWISVSITDTSGNESNVVVFPFEFISEVVPEAPLPPPFNRENIPRLGHIDIDLFNPHQLVDRGHEISEGP